MKKGMEFKKFAASERGMKNIIERKDKVQSGVS